MKFIVSYTINEPNDQFVNSALWQGNIEKDDFQEAIKVYDNLKALDEEYTKTAFPYFGKLTRIAVFKLDGKRTFHNKPRRLCDRRDKSEWIITADLGGLINSRSSADL
jgi:hypothetical protein